MEYGWKPHRVLARKGLSRAWVDWHVREQERGTVSSNSKFQTNSTTSTVFRQPLDLPRALDVRAVGPLATEARRGPDARLASDLESHFQFIRRKPPPINNLPLSRGEQLSKLGALLSGSVFTRSKRQKLAMRSSRKSSVRGLIISLLDRETWRTRREGEISVARSSDMSYQVWAALLV